jgi:hypothetical protein
VALSVACTETAPTLMTGVPSSLASTLPATRVTATEPATDVLWRPFDPAMPASTETTAPLRVAVIVRPRVTSDVAPSTNASVEPST